MSKNCLQSTTNVGSNDGNSGGNFGWSGSISGNITIIGDGARATGYNSVSRI